MEYTIDYFIDKFKKIDPKFWTIGVLEDKDGFKCVLGHCGVKTLCYPVDSGEGRVLTELFEGIKQEGSSLNGMELAYMINDNQYWQFKQPTPKERVLAALSWLKNKKA